MKSHLRGLLVALMAATPSMAVMSQVDLNYASYQGSILPVGITQWLGMRYAAPPIGNLRFRAPADVPIEEGIQQATTHGNICLGTGSPVNETGHGEDCLFINVQAPTWTSTKSKLPVFVFIQGGEFNNLSNPNINATDLINDNGINFIVVDFNYRVGPYGFLSNADGMSANNGLRDQLKALQWVKQHIRFFGGDPNHIVVGGLGAGADSAILQMFMQPDTNDMIFHAIIAESPTSPTMLTTHEAAYMYHDFAGRFGCLEANTLACLRDVSADEMQAKNYNVPFPGRKTPPLYMWLPVIDQDFITDSVGHRVYYSDFVDIPGIFGDVANGGTLFTPRDASSIEDSDKFLQDQYPFLKDRDLETLDDIYPDANETTCPASGCFWRQVSTAYQEVRFTCPALYATEAEAAKGIGRVYNYYYHARDKDDQDSGIGVRHGIDFDALLGPNFGNLPKSYHGGKNKHVSRIFQRYFTNFIKTYDPNQPIAPVQMKSLMPMELVEDQAKWTPWSFYNKKRLLFQTGGKTGMEFLPELQDRCEYWNKINRSIQVPA